MRFITAGILASLHTCSPAFAETPCDYEHKVNSQFTKQIDKTENVDRKVFPYVDDTRKCIMKMDIFIDGVSYPGEGEFVFGPDISENLACTNAMQKAKQKVIQSVSPEILNAKTDMSCEQKQTISIQTTPVKIEPIKKVVYEEPVVTRRVIYSEPVVTERIIYTEPQYSDRNRRSPDLIDSVISAFSIFNYMNR